ncbi:MAG: hypothetical protein ACYTGC_01225 [Planctomycetota bacterium]|jgi:hypothetical protein
MHEAIRAAVAAALPLGAVAVLLAGGCVSSGSRAQTDRDLREIAAERSVQPDDAQLTVSDLDRLTRSFADRYLTLIGSACEALEEDNPSLEQRRLANMLRLWSVTSMYDIATEPEPFDRFIDQLLVVTLQSQIWIDDARADDSFGDRALVIITPLRQAREEIWDLASRVLTSEQLETLDFLIWDWRNQHPEVQFAAFVRFDDFAASSEKAFVSEARSGGGLLAPVEEATQAVDEARQFGERAFYMSKRAPLLATWSVKQMVNDVLITPEVAQLLDDYHRMTEVSVRAVDAIEALPVTLAREREEVEDLLTENSDRLSTILDDYRSSIAETQELAGALQDLSESGERIVETLGSTSDSITGTVDAVDRVLLRYDRDGDGIIHDPDDEPVSITIDRLSAATERLGETVREVNKLIESTGGLLEADAWSIRMKELDSLGDVQVQRAREQGASLIDRAFWRLCIFAVLIFALLLAYARVSHSLRLRRRLATSKA